MRESTAQALRRARRLTEGEVGGYNLSMKMSEFVQNERIVQEIQNNIETGRMPHAVIVEGAKGLGKETLVRIIANACVCRGNTKPCGECSDCRKFMSDCHPDVKYLDGNEPSGLSVDKIRGIRQDAYIKPNEADKKVYVLLGCEKMLPPAQNAFLKVLEEPPDNVVFLLTATSATALLETVRSRARVYSLTPVGIDEETEYLQKRFADKAYEEIRNAAENSMGNIGMAVELLENGGEEAVLLAEEIFAAIPARDEYKLLTLTYKMIKDRAFAMAVTDSLLQTAGDAVKASVGAQYRSQCAKDAAEKMSGKRLYGILQTLYKAKTVLKTNVNLNFFCTWLCAALRT